MKNRENANARAERLAKLEFAALLEQQNREERRRRESKKQRRWKPDFYSHYLQVVK